MEHIRDTMTCTFDSWQYYRNRWAFYRAYYPDHADQWIAEDKRNTKFKGSTRRSATKTGGTHASRS